MKNILTLLLVFSCVSTSIKAQKAPPGGIRQPRFWYITDENASQPSLKNILHPDSARIPVSGTVAKNGTLNFHPAINFAGKNQLTINLEGSNLLKASYFTVYQTTEATKENIIWHTVSNEAPALVLTTSRMADLTDSQYISFTDINPATPKVNVYLHQKIADSISYANQQLYLGDKPAGPYLPVINFKGLIPELIIYDRALSSRELLQVSSYLCLKYGITLSEPEATYLNSAGQVIWDGTNYSDFHHNIAGIIRDDSSGLFQKKATNSDQPSRLVVSTKDSLLNNNSLLWGDNNKPLTPADKVPGVPTMLQKQGIMVKYGITDSIRTNLELDTRLVDIPYPLKPIFWLAIDRTGKGKFKDAATTDYIKMSHLDEQKIAHFKDVTWKRNDFNTERFGIIAGNEILLATEITDPRCASPRSGKLEIKVHGAIFPYKVQVLQSNGVFNNTQTSSSEDKIIFSGLAAGSYTIIVNDAQKRMVIDSFYVNNEDGPQVAAIDSKYLLQEGRTLPLDASQGMPDGISYTWKGPPGFAATGPGATISQAGAYTLTTTKNGCAFVKEFLVQAPPKNVFTNILTYPNPSSNGYFEVKISLDKVAPVKMSIFSEDGRLIDTKDLDGLANYNFSGYIGAGGLYHLVFKSGLSVKASKIIILK